MTTSPPDRSKDERRQPRKTDYQQFYDDWVKDEDDPERDH